MAAEKTCCPHCQGELSEDFIVAASARIVRARNTPAQRRAAAANGKRGGPPKGAKDSKPRKPKGEAAEVAS
jgi:hypothetical protein